MSEKVIDASAEMHAAEQRGAANLGDARRQTAPGAKIFFIIVLVFGLLLAGFLTWQAIVIKHKRAADTASLDKQQDTLGTPMKALHTDAADATPTLATASTAPTVAPIQPQATATANRQMASNNGQPPRKSPAELLRDRRLGYGFTADTNGAAPAQSAQAAPPGYYPPPAGYRAPATQGGMQTADDDGHTLDKLLSPVRLHSETAGQIGKEDFLLLQGSIIPCVLVTRIDSSLPGMVSCDVTADVYSENGRTVLLDRGTRITGQYEHGLQQGQNRLFVVWSRAVTPAGVVVNLDSPGADQLGASGFDGKVNNHFWKRFGAAILLSVIEDFGQYEIAKEQASSANNGAPTLYFGNTQQASQDIANTVLQKTINIPPTLTKRNGELISIFVARDLDFSSIYALRPANAAP